MSEIYTTKVILRTNFVFLEKLSHHHAYSNNNPKNVENVVEEKSREKNVIS